MPQLTLAKPDHAERLLRLVGDFHAEKGIDLAEEQRLEAILPLLEGSPHGAIYLAGPVRAPVGYVAISFGWSLELGGLDGTIDEIYIRPAVRGRGIGAEILAALPRTLARAGLRAVHLRIDRTDPRARKRYEKLHFIARDECLLMTQVLHP